MRSSPSNTPSVPLDFAAVGVRSAPRFLTASVARELGILLTLSVMFPIMIHVFPVPEDTRLGPMLLPIFYAPLLAALWGRTQTAWGVALAAPWLNSVLTSHPAPRGAILITLELAVFVFVLRTLLARCGPRWFYAAPAYLAAMIAATLAATLRPELIDGRPALSWALQSVTTALPGIAVLVLINWAVLRCYPPGPAGGGPATA